jgi:hypothetical protein
MSLISVAESKHAETSMRNPQLREFLTHQTTCTSEMLEKTTCENYCQKEPPVGGGTPGQATRGTCRLGQCRQGDAATAITGMWPSNIATNGRLAMWAMPPPPLLAG